MRTHTYKTDYSCSTRITLCKNTNQVRVESVCLAVMLFKQILKELLDESSPSLTVSYYPMLNHSIYFLISMLSFN